MYINEIPVGTEITIKAKLQDNETEFITTSIEHSELIDRYINTLESKLNTKVLLVKLLEQDGKTLTFDSNKLNLKLEVTLENKSYTWNRVSINKLEIDKNNKYTIITSSDNINYTNRRETFRVSVGLSSIIQVSSNRKTDNATIKDISNNGIGLIVNSNTYGNIGDRVSVAFTDNKRKASFNIECLIVRIENINERKKLFGCKITNSRPNPSYYINRLQREELQNKR